MRSTVGWSCCPLMIALTTFLALRWEQILRPPQKCPSYSSLASGPLDLSRNKQEKTGNWQDYCADTQMCIQLGVCPGVDLQGTQPGRYHWKKTKTNEACAQMTHLCTITPALKLVICALDWIICAHVLLNSCSWFNMVFSFSFQIIWLLI